MTAESPAATSAPSSAAPRVVENVLVVGATSGIAQALCRTLAERGCRVAIAGRNQAELARLASDLNVRSGAECFALPFDALDFASHPRLVAECIEKFGGTLHGAVLCHGTLGDELAARTDFNEAHKIIDVNFTSCVSLLQPLAAHLEANRSGWLCVVSSVAGDRGRQSNYCYGSAKAGLTAYVQGLRNRLQPANVAVLTVKPGFVDTAMTKGKVNPKSPLVAKPERVAADIDRAIRGRRNVLYTPWFWQGIMGVVCSIPEFVFKRLKM